MYNSNYYHDHMLHLNAVLPAEQAAAMIGAIRRGDQIAVQGLIERNPALARLALDRLGNTALHIAARQPRPNLNIIFTLLGAGANPWEMNWARRTPRDVAANGDVRAILVQRQPAPEPYAAPEPHDIVLVDMPRDALPVQPVGFFPRALGYLRRAGWM